MNPTDAYSPNDEERAQVMHLQAAMGQDSRPAFDNPDVENLNILIRVSFETAKFLRAVPMQSPFPADLFDDLRYVFDKTLFHVDSFRAVLNVYGITERSTTSSLKIDSFSPAELSFTYLGQFQAFLSEPNFEQKCRILLDLFKLQLMFVGIFYDCGP